MQYITSAISLRKQLLILQTLRDQAIEKNDGAEVAQLSAIISRIEEVTRAYSGNLVPRTLH